MEIIQSLDIDFKKLSVVTIGNFDGLHSGHQKLIETVKKYSQDENLISILISFSPHPSIFFDKQKNFSTILSEEEKAYELQKFGLDFFLNLDFNLQFASLEAEDFAEILFEKLMCKVLVVGQDYRFGKGRKGDFTLLKNIGKKYGARVIKISQVTLENKKVSSSLIKEYLLKSDLDTANKLLNKPFYAIGNVVKGNQLGRTINFPTVNILPVDNKIILQNGVYVTQVEYNSKVYNSVTNIGVKPTVSVSSKLIETFIFDFDKQIYGEKIKVMFYKYIRDEKKFSSLEELKVQIAKDTLFTKEFFECKNDLSRS